MAEAAIANETKMVQVEAEELNRLRSMATHHEAIMSKEREVSRLRDKYLAAKDASLAAKKTMDQAINELGDIISEGPDKQLKLFDTKPEPEDWSVMPIDRLDVTPGMRKKLAECGATTLGSLAKLDVGQDEEYPDGLLSIPRLGPEKVQKIRAAMKKLIPEDELNKLKVFPADDAADEEPTAEPEVAEEQPEVVAEDVAEVEEAEVDPFADDEQEVTAVDDVFDSVEDESSNPKSRIRLTASIPGLESYGFVDGSEHDAVIMGDNAEVEHADLDEPQLLTAKEFVVLQPASST